MQNYYKMFKDGDYLDVYYGNITDLTISSNWFDTNSVFYMCYHLWNLTNCNIDFWKGTAKDFSLESTFEGCGSLTNINVSNWNMTNVSCLRNTFTYCSNLTSLDVSNWDVSNVKDMSYLFSSCSNLTNLDMSNWNVRKVVDISSLFSYCSNLTNLNLSNWNFTKLKNIEGTFTGCVNLTNLDISNWNVSQVSSLSGTFSDLDCSIFANSLKKWDVKNVTNFSYTFSSCPNLNLLMPIVQNWNFSNAKNIDYLFGFPSLDGSQNLSLTNLNICNVEHADFVFACPSNLRTLNISGWNACNLTSMYGLVERGRNLQDIYMNDWNLASLSLASGCFTQVPNGCNIWVPNLKIKKIFLNDSTATNLTNIRIQSPFDWDMPDNFTGQVGKIKTLNIAYEGSLVLDHPNDFSVSVTPTSSTFFNASASIDTTNQIITLSIEGIDEGEDSIIVTLQDLQGHSLSHTVLITVVGSVYSYEVIDLATTYKFTLNANDYYESNNQGKANSFALCKLKFQTNTGNLFIDCINYAEAGCDYGILSTIDKTLTSSYTADTNNVYTKFNTSAQNISSIQTVTYTITDEKEHFIYIKYRKDSSVNSNNDSLQFKVRFE